MGCGVAEMLVLFPVLQLFLSYLCTSSHTQTHPPKVTRSSCLSEFMLNFKITSISLSRSY